MFGGQCYQNVVFFTVVYFCLIVFIVNSELTLSPDSRERERQLGTRSVQNYCFISVDIKGMCELPRAEENGTTACSSLFLHSLSKTVYCI